LNDHLDVVLGAHLFTRVALFLSRRADVWDTTAGFLAFAVSPWSFDPENIHCYPAGFGGHGAAEEPRLAAANITTAVAPIDSLGGAGGNTCTPTQAVGKPSVTELTPRHILSVIINFIKKYKIRGTQAMTDGIDLMLTCAGRRGGV